MQQLGGSWNQGSEERRLLSLSADRRSVHFFDIASDGRVLPSGNLELPAAVKSPNTSTSNANTHANKGHSPPADKSQNDE